MSNLLSRRNAPSSTVSMPHITTSTSRSGASNSTAPLLSPSPTSSESDYGSTISPKHEHPIRVGNHGLNEDDGVDSFDTSSIESQSGVQQADAINQAWTRPALVTTYALIFLSSFASALQGQVMADLLPYVVSEFSSHSLIPTIAITSSVLSGVLKLPVAKMIDSWGRPQGFAFVTLLAALGLVLMSFCQNVQTYAAAQVIYTIGISGSFYILDIIIADTSSLRNRSLAFSFGAFPYFLTTFIGPPIASAFVENERWRYAFSASAFFLVILSFPLFYVLIFNTRKARRLGILQTNTKSGPWTVQKLHQSLVDLDAIGMVLLGAGLTLILVPISLSNRSIVNTGLNSYTVSLLLGFVLTVAFFVHERKAERPFIQFSLLCSRNVAGACLLSITIFVAYFAWDGYYTSYLQVVHGLTITQAGYVGHIYAIGSSIWGFVVGYLIRRSDRFKWVAIAALPVHIIGGALMIVFRRPDNHMFWLVFCQILITIGGSTLVICQQMAVMAVAKHGELASAMAILSLAGYLGTAIGSSLSGAIWNSTLPGALTEQLPNLTLIEIGSIASDLKKQLSYPLGSPTRDAIIAAYGKSQMRMCIAGTLITLLEIGAVMIWRDVRMSRSKQVKGTVI
ncbi:MFS general substrate transporter [Xylariaceae sp. FL0255]|nr:MFS general substrate transporter [Xylariaceae sp. FL0255]